MNTQTKPQMNRPEATEYAPYHTFPAFTQGFDDYTGNVSMNARPQIDILAAAYDRGAEYAMRLNRYWRGVGLN